MLLVGACTGETPSELPREPVVVYASYADKSYLPLLFEAYTEATGVVVIVRQGDAGAIVGDVIENAISPPADILLTPSVLGVYRAAEEGALRPIDAGILGDVAPALRDPDQFWVALSYRFAAIVSRGAGPGVVQNTADVAELAAPAFEGRLCLSSSRGPMNTLLIANLIRRLGAREAELVVRGWVDNLARPVFATDAELRDALAAGACDVGVVAGGATSPPLQEKKLSDTADIEGVGIARHARNPEGALELVEWLLSEDVQERHAALVGAMPAISDYAGEGNVGAAAWRAADAVLLAERARYP